MKHEKNNKNYIVKFVKAQSTNRNRALVYTPTSQSDCSGRFQPRVSGLN
jgi:hypothetical protein